MKLVLRNTAYSGRKQKEIHTRWAVFEDGEPVSQWFKLPYDQKEKAFKRVFQRLNWNIHGFRRIAISAEINKLVGIVLKGIMNDDNFTDRWENVKDMEFKKFIKRLYSYYAGMLLE